MASDGRDLVLDVVKDAMGIWFDHTVAIVSNLRGRWLTGIFNALANRLLVWQGKDRDERYASLHGADIAYAEALAPAAFSGMIAPETGTGRLSGSRRKMI